MVAAPLVLDDSLTEEENMDAWDAWTPDPYHAQNCNYNHNFNI